MLIREEWNHGCTRMHTDEMKFGHLSERIIGCAITAANTLGAGFLEKVYENALAHELRKAGLEVCNNAASRFAMTA
jgi:hypothetical protein